MTMMIGVVVAVTAGKSRTYLNLDPLRTQSPHLTPRDPQPPRVRHARDQIARLPVDDRVIATGVDGDGGIAGGHGQLGEEVGRQELLEVLERPVDGHGPFIAAVVEFAFSFEDRVADSGLGGRCQWGASGVG